MPPDGPRAPSPAPGQGRRGVDHLLAEVRGLDRDMLMFLVTWLSAAHPGTAIAGLDAARAYHDSQEMAEIRAAAGLSRADMPARPWVDSGTGPGWGVQR